MRKPEQKQLDLIRGRVYVLKTATLHGPVPLQTTMDLVTDIDDLLSLVKEQGPYTCEACGRSDEHTPECPTAAWCPGCGSRVIGHQWTTCYDAATAMRSACVEKVRQMRTEWQKYEMHAREDPLRNHLLSQWQAANKIIEALETLSIEQPR